MLALVNNVPKVLNLKQLIKHYIDHRKEIVTKRTKFDLKKAQERSHILEGIIIMTDEEITRIFEILAHSGQIEHHRMPLISKGLASFLAGVLYGLPFGILIVVIFF